MFADSFNFYTGYAIPKCKTLDQFMEFIQHLPSSDTPQVFGLHSNADITYVIHVYKYIVLLWTIESWYFNMFRIKVFG